MHGTVMMINMTIYDNYPLELGHSLFSDKLTNLFNILQIVFYMYLSI